MPPPLAQNHIGQHALTRDEKRSYGVEGEGRIDDRILLKVRDRPPKTATAGHRPEVTARDFKERLALAHDVPARVGVLVKAIGLALGKEHASANVAKADGERMARTCVRSGIDPTFLNPESRFGRAFYVVTSASSLATTATTASI